MSLLSICGGMELHTYIEKVSLWRGCEDGIAMIWTKWDMIKVVVNEWIVIWCYEVCALMSSDKWKCMTYGIWYA